MATVMSALLFTASGSRAAERARLRVEVHGISGNLKERAEALSFSGDLKKNVLSILSIEKARKEKDLTEARIRSLHEKAEEEIRTALQPFGYYKPVIQASLTVEKGVFVAEYRVDRGPPLPVAEVVVDVAGEGADDPGFSRLAARFPLEKGDTLDHRLYEAGKKAFEDYAASTGYLDGTYRESKVEVDLDDYSARVVLHYDTGPRYLFGPVRFHQDILEPALLQRYVPWTQGEQLGVHRILRLQDALSGSHYFSRVEVEPKQEEAVGREVPIDVNLTAGPKRRWVLGIGYGTDTGPRGSVLLQAHRLNRKGHHGEAELKASVVEKSLAVKYIIPGKRPLTDSLGITFGFADFRPSTSKSDTFLTGVSFARELGHLRRVLSLTYQREAFTVGVDKGTTSLLIPEASATHLVRDDPTYARRGHRVRLLVRGAVESVLSSAGFLQADLEGKLVRPLGERSRFIARAELGYLATGAFRSLPPRIRFFAGGDQSVRGYRFQRLGRLDEEGNVIGGETLRVASVELERMFSEWLGGLGGAVFVDVGNASRSFSDPIRKSVGAGIRWKSPIGFARVDAAFPQGENGFPVVLHVSIGPDL